MIQIQRDLSGKHATLFSFYNLEKAGAFSFNCEYAYFWQQYKATHAEQKLFIHEQKSLKISSWKYFNGKTILMDNLAVHRVAAMSCIQNTDTSDYINLCCEIWPGELMTSCVFMWTWLIYFLALMPILQRTDVYVLLELIRLAVSK